MYKNKARSLQTSLSAALRLLVVLLLVGGMQTVVAAPRLKLLDGKSIDFASLQGKWVLINYWASWCGPCLDEIQDLNRFASAQADKARVFGVNYDMLPATEQVRLSAEYQLAYPSLAEDPRAKLRLGGIRGVPVTFVFNPQGKLVNKLRGGQSYKSLLAVISR